jgi:hypothetical protein
MIARTGDRFHSGVGLTTTTDRRCAGCFARQWSGKVMVHRSPLNRMQNDYVKIPARDWIVNAALAMLPEVG